MGTITTERPRALTAVLVAAVMVFALLQTLVIPAVPTIARTYGVGPEVSGWVLTAFLLSASVLTPVIGRLGERYGKGRVLVGVLIVMGAGGALGALAPNIGVLIGARAVQGVAGGVFPLAFGIAREALPRERVAGAVSLISTIFGAGAAVGLPLSGVIVDSVSVSWLFWLGLVALPVAWLVSRLVPASPGADHARVDWVGAALLGAGLAAVLVAVTQSEAWGPASPATLGSGGGGVVLLVAWLLVERRVPSPLVSIEVLVRPAVWATNLTTLVVGFGLFSGFVLIPSVAQARGPAGLGLDPALAGLLLLPSAVTQVLAGPWSGRLGGRIGFRPVLVLGGLLLAASFALIALVRTEAWQLAASGALLGVGAGVSFSAIANLVVDAVAPDEVAVVTGINAVVRTVGASFGSAASVALIALTAAAGGSPTATGYTLAFTLSAVAGLAATGTALLVPGPRMRRPAGAAPADAGGPA